MLMVQAVDRYPAGWRILDAAHAQDDEGPLQPFGTNQPTVGEQAMIADDAGCVGPSDCLARAAALRASIGLMLPNWRRPICFGPTGFDPIGSIWGCPVIVG